MQASEVFDFCVHVLGVEARADMCHHLAAPSFVNTVVCFQGLNLLVSDGDIFNRRFTSVSVSFYQAVFLLDAGLAHFSLYFRLSSLQSLFLLHLPTRGVIYTFGRWLVFVHETLVLRPHIGTYD